MSNIEEFKIYLENELAKIEGLLDTERDYEIRLHDLINKLQNGKYKKDNFEQYEIIKNLIINNINKDKESRDLSYRAFYLLSIYTRRNKDVQYWKNVYDSYHLHYSKYRSLTHILNVYYLSTSIPESSYDDLLQNSKKLKNEFVNNSGYLHSYCDIVATIYEESSLYNNKTIKQKIIDDYLDDAIITINLAIEKQPDYAKFYCTKGRLKAIDGKVFEGIKLIQQAINVENSNSTGYMNKILYYESHIQYIRLQALQESNDKNSDKLKSELLCLKEEANDRYTKMTMDFDSKMESNLIRNIEVLTFFTGLIGFLVSGISIGENISDSNIFKYIIMVFSAFLISFSSMDLLIRKKSLNFKILNTYVINVIIILLGLGVIFFAYLKPLV